MAKELNKKSFTQTCNGKKVVVNADLNAAANILRKYAEQYDKELKEVIEKLSIIDRWKLLKE